MADKKYIYEIKELMQEWDYEANKDLDPTKLTIGSNKKAWWRCSKCGGKWQTHICGRTGKENKHHTGCPYCAGQKVLVGYNDFASKYPELLKQWHPIKNTLKPTEVMSGTSKKVWWICPNGHEYEQAINARILHPSSCPICSGQKVAEGINDLQSKYPDVAKEWLQDKNGIITPTIITWGSNKKFWWKCSTCGHEWQARVSDRTRDHNGCPACANKVLVKGFNDLATKFPNIAKEWHPTRNGDLTPSDVKYGSRNKVWWICHEGHEFQQGIIQRANFGQGCPYCSNHKVLPGYNDLATKFPDIAKEWHPTKNGDLKPTDVSPGSEKKVWWQLESGVEFELSINKRVHLPRKKFNRKKYNSKRKAIEHSFFENGIFIKTHMLVVGMNDLATLNTRLASEWHPTKNGDLKPKDVTIGSGKKVWWKCPVGHEYQATVHDRATDGTNCPICNLRKSTSFPEQAIWYYVKKLYPSAVNKYKECFKNSMEFDIYIPNIKVAIEYDGFNWHKTENEYSRELKKYNFCKQNDIYLIRVKEKTKDAFAGTADQIYYIPKTKRNNFYILEKTIFSILCSIKGFKDIDLYRDISINIERDKNEILNYLSKIDNSLSEVRPDVAVKWNYEKNGDLKPEMFSVGSNEIVWWKCPDCGKEWKTSINSMTSTRYGCPVCSKVKQGKAFTKLRVKQKGSLAENMPELVKEWHPTKNEDLTPNDITSGRFKPVWWKCSKCGYEWQSSPNNRKKVLVVLVAVVEFLKVELMIWKLNIQS